ncbi:uncharacterized protein BX663DRAFT_521402 [Cokeromyces recurvatus]|uniref:uncharacterized protein n=1 Tax=Cokeromyces recurvatus TaxID=90255 RepID=UPI00221FCEBF|nr:uncharacterized protein BX663DRAFT_521402 [Cokeromyces recurvatus]KAI7899351.1 hypothetical protein BX663DRAFT_521402 [Cokeromyces recurvatus]
MTCQHNSMESGQCRDCGYCSHEVIYFGLCAVCGRQVEEDENAPKDHIDMTHNSSGIVVSYKEAKRLEKEDEKRLLKERKLSLIVDLDQTILHAAWEPHIANWVDEQKVKDNDKVKDMSTFSLDGSMNKYTIKLRPGLREFLNKISKYYEMHVYTMGTRAYADAVAKIIDPEGKLFQDRILSRDENGSMTKKRLERLFPSDQTKVIVLDDRADVWDYSPNLIQIKPYEYFAGIGDINAPPLTQPIIATTHSSLPTNDIINEEEEKEGMNVNKIATGSSSTINDININQQELIDIKQGDNVNNENQPNSTLETTEVPLPKEIPREPASSSNNHSNYTPKTNDPDTILNVVEKALISVHKEFYNQVDEKKIEKPNVAHILPILKSEVLKDCFILFSGVIPLHCNAEDSSIWKLATTFGATCLKELTGKVTHLVAANAGTNKVNTARKYSHIKIVSPAWLMDSVWNWKKEDEEDYLVPLPREGSAASEVENPEEAPLDFEVDIDWQDDEVDAVLLEEEEEDSYNDSFSDDDIEEEKKPEKEEIHQGESGPEEEEEDVEDWLNAALVDIDGDSQVTESDYGASQSDDEYSRKRDREEEDFSDDEHSIKRLH